MKQDNETLTNIRKFSYRASPEQLTLSLEEPPTHTEHSLHELITELTGRPIRIKLTDNSTSMLSVREHGSHIAVRLHRMFLGAGQRVIKELAGYIKTRRGKTPLFWEFVNSNHKRISPSKRKQSINHIGDRHDLLEIYKCMNEEYFGCKVDCGITWGVRRRAGRARRRTLGSYSASDNLIRINPLLDVARVPRYYVEFVVYHEMLHAALFVESREAREAAQDNGNGQNKKRRRVHPPEFKRRETEFRDYARAIKWEG